eukprot:6172020-Pleurochrysis_carterae.AAC.4
MATRAESAGLSASERNKICLAEKVPGGAEDESGRAKTKTAGDKNGCRTRNMPAQHAHWLDWEACIKQWNTKLCVFSERVDAN